MKRNITAVDMLLQREERIKRARILSARFTNGFMGNAVVLDNDCWGNILKFVQLLNWSDLWFDGRLNILQCWTDNNEPEVQTRESKFHVVPIRAVNWGFWQEWIIECGLLAQLERQIAKCCYFSRSTQGPVCWLSYC